LGDHQRGLEHLLAARDGMDQEMALCDWYWQILLESSLTELWLAQGDLQQARSQADRFFQVALATAERTWHALAWEARVAMAQGNLQAAQDWIAKAVATAENFDVPLAAWRVHSTAAALHRSTGNTKLAERVHELSQAIVVKLASSLEEPLRQSFLSGLPPVKSPSTVSHRARQEAFGQPSRSTDEGRITWSPPLKTTNEDKPN
jgi:hypothetical protein